MMLLVDIYSGALETLVYIYYKNDFILLRAS